MYRFGETKAIHGLKACVTMWFLLVVAVGCQATPQAEQSEVVVPLEGGPVATGFPSESNPIADSGAPATEAPKFPPWFTSAYSDRQHELSDIFGDAYEACLADLGVVAPKQARDRIPLHIRTGVMDLGKAELFAYGATFQIASRFELYPLEYGSEAEERLFRRTDTQQCYEPAEAARANAAGPLEDRSDPEVLAMLGVMAERATSTREYEAWSQAWHSCMSLTDVEPRSVDPLAHASSILATFSGRLAGEGIVVQTEPDDGNFTLEWFEKAVAETPSLQAAFEEERRLARADAGCVAETSTALAAAIEVARDVTEVLGADPTTVPSISQEPVDADGIEVGDSSD